MSLCHPSYPSPNVPSRLRQNHLSISGGGFHACGLYYDGKKRESNVKAYCVGLFDEDADQDFDQLDIPDLGEGMYWREMSAGGAHSCGIDNDRMWAVVVLYIVN